MKENISVKISCPILLSLEFLLSLRTHVVVAPVELLALPELLLDEGELALQQLLLALHQLQVQVEAAHALQLVQAQPAPPPHAHAVQDEGGADVNLDTETLHQTPDSGEIIKTEIMNLIYSEHFTTCSKVLTNTSARV